jgi:hypothetical protein
MRSLRILTPGKVVLVQLTDGTNRLLLDQPSENRAYTAESILAIAKKDGVSSNAELQQALSKREIVLGAGLGFADAKQNSLGDFWKKFFREAWSNDNPCYKGLPARYQFAAAREALLELEPSAEGVLVNAAKVAAVLAVTAVSGGWGPVAGVVTEGAFEVYSARNDICDTVKPEASMVDDLEANFLERLTQEEAIDRLRDKGFTVLGSSEEAIAVEQLLIDDR